MTADARLLDLQHVSVSFDGFKALNDLNFTLQPGELHFLIGPNGAGKTTLLDVITGRTRPDTGTALFAGATNILHTPIHKLARIGIGRKFQTPTVFGTLTVYQNLETAIGFKASFGRLLGKLTTQEAARIESTLHLIGLGARAHAPAAILAHGEKQWLEIGMLLVQAPQLLLLDEPVAGMTRTERNRTGELLQRIVQSCTVLVVEHDMEFVRNFASQVTVMHLGSVLTQGPVAQVQNDPRVVEVYIGRSRTH